MREDDREAAVYYHAPASVGEVSVMIDVMFVGRRLTLAFWFRLAAEPYKVRNHRSKSRALCMKAKICTSFGSTS